MKLKSILWMSVCVFGLGCAKKADSAVAEQVARDVKSGLGCSNIRSLVFDSMYRALESSQASVEPDSIKQKFFELTQEISRENQSVQKFQIESLQESFARIIDTFYSVPNQKPDQLLKQLIQYELGNTSSPNHVKAKRELEESFSQLLLATSSMNLECAAPTPPVAENPTKPAPVPAAVNSALTGAHFAMATAYQSCEVLDLPQMTSNTENVQGIRKGKDIGGGFQREYQSIPDILRTHYYFRGQRYPAGCYDLTKKPLVYDYGGEPSVETRRLNFFVNSGPGGKALGIDCSSFVSSALAAAGLRYSPGIENKPVFVRQTSYDFINPTSSGWKCFSRVSMKAQETLLPGDIMSVQGHVLMIDRVGPDAFGLQSISSLNACSQISAKKFDFTVIQSSSSKQSIGINRYEARDYLEEEDRMRTAFVAYAKAACRARFSGAPEFVSSSDFGLIRHKGTPECRAPRIELAGQSCISDCREFRN